MDILTKVRRFKRKVKESPCPTNKNLAVRFMYFFLYAMVVLIDSLRIVYFRPFYLVEESLSDETHLNLMPKLAPCTVTPLGPSEIKLISKSPEVDDSEETFLRRLANGWLCLGLRHNGEIVAYTWCNLRKCDSSLLTFPLKEDEAYLTYAYTFKSYRGKNLAPYLRYELYKYLSELGRKTFFSITEFFNVSAILFKRKLRAKPVKFYLLIYFSEKLRWTLLLRIYKKTADTLQSVR